MKVHILNTSVLVTEHALEKQKEIEVTLSAALP